VPTEHGIWNDACHQDGWLPAAARLDVRRPSAGQPWRPTAANRRIAASSVGPISP